MNFQTFETLRKEFISDAQDVCDAKFGDYATKDPDGDCLRNFKDSAKLLGLEPRHIWAVYFYKHVCSVMRWARDGKVDSEGVRGRLVDLHNYVLLGNALYEEETLE